MRSDQQGRRFYYPELDGVRAVAALLVMVFHFCQAKHFGGAVILGQTGVDLFFVLSGFLITGILLRAEPGDWREVRTFYVRRSLRIFPLYYGFLLLAAVLGWRVAWPYWVYVDNYFLAVKSALGGPTHLWSLAVEEQFYLVWPFLLLFLPRRRLLAAMWGVAGLAVLTRVVLIFLPVSPFYFGPARLDGLAAGGLLAIYHQRGLLQRHRGVLLGMMAGAGVGVWAEWWGFHRKALPLVEISKFTLVTMFYAGAVGYLVSGGQSPVNGWLRWTPLRFLGRISYGLYVFHPGLILFVLRRTSGWGTGRQAVACLGVTVAAAVVSWYGFERPILTWKDRLAPERTPMEAPLTVAGGSGG